MLQRLPDGFLRWISSLDNAHTVSICSVYQVFEKFKAAGSCCALYSTKNNDFSI